jgi:hypothetical protein
MLQKAKKNPQGAALAEPFQGPGRPEVQEGQGKMTSTCVGLALTLRRLEALLSELAVYPGSWVYRRALERRWNKLRWIQRELELAVEEERARCEW